MHPGRHHADAHAGEAGEQHRPGHHLRRPRHRPGGLGPEVLHAEHAERHRAARHRAVRRGGPGPPGEDRRDQRAAEQAGRPRGERVEHRDVERHQAALERGVRDPDRDHPAGAAEHREGERADRGDGEHDRVVDQGELRDAVRELQQERDRSGGEDQDGHPLQQRAEPGRAGLAGLGAGEQHRVRQHQGAADHQHVGRAPLRDVLAEQPVPQVVEGEAEQREQRDAGADRRTDRDPPARGEGEGTPGEPVPGEREGERAPGEDRDQPEEDQVVRRVGQRALVAAERDVVADVPVEADRPGEGAEHAHQQGEREPAGAAVEPGRRVRGPAHEGAVAGALADHDPEDRGVHRGGEHGHDEDLVARCPSRRRGGRALCQDGPLGGRQG